ncbi:Ryanodine receptor 2 [Crenichthys baileyi]|uniref:Ryanodine receptor 2 n=1 Tax=Crenichthys baileyi TaxID=28760 RepID=A0AAV9SQ08_9TELE
MRHSPSSVSWALPWASSRWDVPGTPPEEGVQEASDMDARATSTGSSRCGGAAALLRAPPRWPSLLTLSLREAHFSRLYPGTRSIGHDPKFMAIAAASFPFPSLDPSLQAQSGRQLTMADLGEGEDEIQFLRTDDEVVLQCSATIQKEQQKLCLAAEGFGNRLCFLESISNSKNVPPDLSICTFVLEQSLSVRALQEMLANTEEKTDGAAQGGGHRTLLYGHAVLLRHSYSGMFLCCLSTSRSSTDKLAFDVGLQEETTGEACWWTIHPASKQRSEGEKVRVGDDLILVSVSSERYLVSC